MGGHGALISTLRNPGLYKSVSAFAPICNPIQGAWGIKALGGYLGDDKSKWVEWDATELVKKYDGPPLTLLIDQVFYLIQYTYILAQSYTKIVSNLYLFFFCVPGFS